MSQIARAFYHCKYKKASVDYIMTQNEKTRVRAKAKRYDLAKEQIN